MTGFYSDGSFEINAIELKRREVEKTSGYLNLMSSNPTEEGFLFPQEILLKASQVYFQNREYRPDPRGLYEARVAIAKYYQKRNPAWIVRPQNIFLTASTSESYAHLFSLLTSPGDKVLSPEITYPLYDYLAEMKKLELSLYPLREDKNWDHDESELEFAIDEDTKAMLIVSPHNPTGKVWIHRSPALLKSGLPIIADEVFSEFTFGLEHVPPIGALYNEQPVFVLNGISKMFALPDLKLGWMVLNDMALDTYGERLELLNDTFLSANGLSQYLIPTLFKEGEDFVRSFRQTLHENMRLCYEALSAHPRLSLNPPDGGWYLFVKVDGYEDEDQLVIDLLEEGAYVHPGYFYGYEDGAHFVFSVLGSREKLQRGLDIILSALK